MLLTLASLANLFRTFYFPEGTIIDNSTVRRIGLVSYLVCLTRFVALNFSLIKRLVYFFFFDTASNTHRKISNNINFNSEI